MTPEEKEQFRMLVMEGLLGSFPGYVPENQVLARALKTLLTQIESGLNKEGSALVLQAMRENPRAVVASVEVPFRAAVQGYVAEIQHACNEALTAVGYTIPSHGTVSVPEPVEFKLLDVKTFWERLEES